MVGVERSDNIRDFATTLSIGGVEVELHERLSGLVTGSDIQIQIEIFSGTGSAGSAGSRSTGWSSNDPVSLLIRDTKDGHLYQVTGMYRLLRETTTFIYLLLCY